MREVLVESLGEVGNVHVGEPRADRRRRCRLDAACRRSSGPDSQRR
ncbi:MAG TPA: hypothetical protein VNP96_04675 [Solirubrobacterales bacterium]|nr:hypothetical protein [Solirubrobacterales bacterium]